MKLKEYDVTITETLQMTIPIRAASRAEAEERAEAEWNQSKYVLGAEQFVGADFHAEERRKERTYER
ncbi:DpnD/PcfM family protein [Dorea sp. YH-dor228]|uniref:DpnD/PcfM family protein n=1 Tax=Dorea sp. YH-dor228 TaxID=3151120 RepID=UPI0032420149